MSCTLLEVPETYLGRFGANLRHAPKDPGATEWRCSGEIFFEAPGRGRAVTTRKYPQETQQFFVEKGTATFFCWVNQ